MWAYGFAMYKQVPEGTSKMKILSRNFISVSIAQKVPARTGKQFPPSNNDISKKPFQCLLLVQRKQWWPSTVRPFLPQWLSPSRAEQCSGASMCWAAQPTLASPWCCQACTMAGELEQLDRRVPASETRVSKPAATWSDRQDLEAGRGEGGDEGGQGKHVRQAMADKQKLHKHKQEKRSEPAKQ